MKHLDNCSEIPTFVNKLWKMVKDPKTNDMVCWSKSGRSIFILEDTKFWLVILPLYFKHNNMHSFIRQLNMYGFRKKTCPFELQTNKEGKHFSQFMHPHFQKGQPHLLKNIKRKVARSKVACSSNISHPEEATELLEDVKSLWERLNSVDVVLSDLKQADVLLWQDVELLRQKQQILQQILNKLGHTLFSFVQSPKKIEETSLKSHSLIDQDTSKKLKSPTIHEFATAVFLESENTGVNSLHDEETENCSTIFETEDTLDLCSNKVARDPLLIDEPDVERIGDPTAKLPSGLDLSTDLGMIQILNISSVLKKGNGTINFKNLKHVCLNSKIQDNC